jgi:phenylalanyl-tRNA synthetase alpha subunit
LFNDYAENLKKMIQTANKNQEALLDIINKIFVYTVDPQTIKKQIRINPLLTEQGLQDIVVETRALIIKLYLSCEMDYVNGLKMYEAIVEQKILETAQSQINNLAKMSDQLITVDSVPVPAEVKQIKEKIEEKINEKKEDIEKQAIDIKKDEAKIEAEVPPVI